MEVSVPPLRTMLVSMQNSIAQDDNETQHIRADNVLSQLIRWLEAHQHGLLDEDWAVVRAIVDLYDDHRSHWWYA